MDYTYKQWSPRLGVVHDIAVAQQVFASISRNFEAPIFGLAGTSTTVNSAQSGTTFEAGARGQSQEDKNQTTWDITFYRANLTNEFLSACVVAGCSTATTTNVPKSMHQGIEMGFGQIPSLYLGA